MHSYPFYLFDGYLRVRYGDEWEQRIIANNFLYSKRFGYREEPNLYKNNSIPKLNIIPLL